MILRTKVILVCLLVILLIGVPPGLGQQPPADKKGNLYKNSNTFNDFVKQTFGHSYKQLRQAKCSVWLLDKTNEQQQTLAYNQGHSQSTMTTYYQSAV